MSSVRRVPGRFWPGFRGRATATADGSLCRQEDQTETDERLIARSGIKSFQDIPGPKPSLPFIGTGWQYFPGGRYNLFELHKANYDKYQRYGPIVKEEYQWKKPVVQIFSPNDFEVVFRSQGKYPQRPANEFIRHYRQKNPHKYDSPGIANSVGEEWFSLRTSLAPVLSKLKELDSVLPALNNISEDLVQLVRQQRNSDGTLSNLQTVLYKLALESIFMMCLDRRLGCLSPQLQEDSDANRMIQAAQEMFVAYQKLYYGLPLWKFFATPAYRLLDRAESTIYDTASKYMSKAMESLSGIASHQKGASVLETVLGIQELSDNERRLTIIDFISGGIFTVTNSLCFLLYHLARNQTAQDRLLVELKDRAPGGEVTPEALSHLPYLRACVKESFRLSPTVPAVVRILPEDVVLSGYHVPAGTAIFCHFLVTCQLSQYFHEPHKFLPERWLSNSAQKQHHPFCMLPFGFGNRMCAGRRFSQMELYTAAAKIVWNFHMTSNTENLDLTHAFIVVPSNPISIKIHDR